MLTWRYGLAWQVQLFSLLTAFISALGSPALYSLLPAVVEHDYLVQANGFVRTLRNIAYVGAPVLAGLIAAHFSAQVFCYCQFERYCHDYSFGSCSCSEKL
ncbi:hypothetical protein [Alloscardovia omnicolens]|uniref:hypothetical protein n=1 Tax=Alloscardovia omnicolens TaxID=419015 RepID=UPI00254FA69A|nr:hypothetical protein [Alloscardovia omnicolens]MDK6445252.1 hypothetical protein [Alloscardovia omnicolens]